MKSDSLKTNIIYQSLYQVIRTITPIITIPIISRAFGPSGVGVVSFSFSMVQYFLMFASVGVQLYFNRLIAEVAHEKTQLSKQFSDIFMSKLLLSLTVLLLYVITISVFIHEYYLIFLLQGIYIIGAVADISWFYAGIEKFKIPSLSNIVASLIVLVIVVFFIRDTSDLPLYVFTLSIVTVLNQLPLYYYLKKYITLKRMNWKNVWHIFRSSLVYLLPNGQLNFFTSIACVVLGLIGSYSDVGIFTNTFNILSVAILLVNTIDLVMIPRITKLARKQDNALTQMLELNINMQPILTVPMVLGIIAIMPTFYVWFFGEQFKSTVSLMNVLAILLFIIPLNMTISRQYLIIQNKMKVYNMSLIIGAFVNFICCIIFIPFFGIFGAGIARITSELLILLWRVIDISGTGIKLDVKNLSKTVFASFVMIVVLLFLNTYLIPTVQSTILLLVAGVAVYLITNLVLKHEFILLILKNLIKRGDNFDRHS